MDLATYADWPVLMGYVRVRNALQHGLGRLTDLQLYGKDRAKTMASISACGVGLNGDIVTVIEADVARCYRVSAEFVAFLDQECI